MKIFEGNILIYSGMSPGWTRIKMDNKPDYDTFIKWATEKKYRCVYPYVDISKKGDNFKHVIEVPTNILIEDLFKLLY